ncbi:MAG: helix-hairpin-helix domain-containing protein [Bacteroidaceae bacterium]
MALLAFVVWVVLMRWHFHSGQIPVWEDTQDSAVWAEYQAFEASLRRIDSVRTCSFSKRKALPEPQLALFDPNVVDSADFVRMGVKPYVAHNLLRYRAKGGVLRTADALARIYGMDAETYQRLLPYIRIAEEYQRPPREATIQLKEMVQKPRRPDKFVRDTVLDLNRVDTAVLQKIPGIGSGIARMIVGYRGRLGGYCRVEQLNDILQANDSLLRWFCVESPELRCLNLNRASVERLEAHPYVNFYQAKVIVEHRRRKGNLRSLEQLSLYEEFTEADLERINPYVCFD